MGDFKERLEIEKDQLGEKIYKLDTFIEGDLFTNLDETAKSLLRIQANAMETYLTCLIERINYLN